MGFKLIKVEKDSEFDPIWLAFRDAFNDPGTPLWPGFMGDIRPHDPVAREAALKESVARWISWHRADLSSTWLKVVDEATGDIAAAGVWRIFTKERGNPYEGHGPIEATWFPEGEARTVGSKWVSDFLATANKNANFPHAFLNVIFTTPKYRRQGAASLIMDWGFQQASENDLDVYIEATKEGKLLYESYGLKAVEESSVKLTDADLPPTDDPDTRKALVKQLTPFTWWSMWGSPKQVQ